MLLKGAFLIGETLWASLIKPLCTALVDLSFGGVCISSMPLDPIPKGPHSSCIAQKC